MHIPSHNGHASKHERQAIHSHTVPVRPYNNRFHNPNRTKPMEPTLKLWLAIFNALGLSSTVGVIVFDWASWKANILFMVCLIFLLIRIYYYVIRQDQAKEMRRLEIEERKKSIEKDIFS